jgi:outer membrane immunogenic protein
VKKLLVVGIAAAAVYGAPALAEPPPSPFNWSGFYVGGTVGGALSTAEVRLHTMNGAPPAFRNVDIPPLNDIGSPNMDGTPELFGGKIGFNHQTGIWVLGLEADISSFRFNKSAFTTGNPFTVGAAPFGGGFANFDTSVSSSWLATIRPRIGFTVDQYLLYFTGGAAFGNLRFSNTYLDFSPLELGSGSEANAANATKVGWTLGGGIDAAIAPMPNWIVSLEYHHVDLGPLHAVGTVTSSNTTTATFNFATHLRSDIVRLGLSYKFGGM